MEKTFCLNMYLTELKTIKNELDLNKTISNEMSLSELLNNLDNYLDQLVSIRNENVFQLTNKYNIKELKSRVEFKIMNHINECFEQLNNKM